MPYSPASPGRINSTQRHFGLRRCARQTSAKHRLCCASRCRVHTSAQILAACLDSRLAPVCPWRLCESPCVGKQGERERNMPLSLSEAALYSHADLYFELLSLAGVTPRITRAKVPKPARGTHSMSSPHATTIEKGRLTETSHLLGIEPFQSPQLFSGVGGPNLARAPLMINQKNGHQDSNASA